MAIRIVLYDVLYYTGCTTRRSPPPVPSPLAHALCWSPFLLFPPRCLHTHFCRKHHTCRSDHSPLAVAAMPRSTAPPPQLLYVIVARYKTVLAEYTASSGNFTTVTRSLLAKLPTHDESMTIVYDNHCFHYIISDDIVFLCMAEEGAKRRIPFAFLHDVRSRWRASYGDAGKTADAFAMQDEFGGLLRTQMVRANFFHTRRIACRVAHRRSSPLLLLSLPCRSILMS